MVKNIDMGEIKDIKSATFQSKSGFKLPKGVTITKKDVTVTVEEIENGFIINKSYDIKWSKESEDGEINTGYEYFTKKWFSETNPISIDEEFEDEMSLADKFE
jgi:hypothetical protein